MEDREVPGGPCHKNSQDSQEGSPPPPALKRGRVLTCFGGGWEELANSLSSPHQPVAADPEDQLRTDQAVVRETQCSGVPLGAWKAPAIHPAPLVILLQRKSEGNTRWSQPERAGKHLASSDGWVNGARRGYRTHWKSLGPVRSAERGEEARVSPVPLLCSGALARTRSCSPATQRSDLIALGSLGTNPPNRVIRLPTEGGQIPQGPTRHVHTRDACVPSALRRVGAGWVGGRRPGAEAGCPSNVCRSLDGRFLVQAALALQGPCPGEGQPRASWVGAPTACPPLQDRA